MQNVFCSFKKKNYNHIHKLKKSNNNSMDKNTIFLVKQYKIEKFIIFCAIQ